MFGVFGAGRGDAPSVSETTIRVDDRSVTVTQTANRINSNDTFESLDPVPALSWSEWMGNIFDSIQSFFQGIVDWFCSFFQSDTSPSDTSPSDAKSQNSPSSSPSSLVKVSVNGDSTEYSFESNTGSDGTYVTVIKKSDKDEFFSMRTVRKFRRQVASILQMRLEDVSPTSSTNSTPTTSPATNKDK